MPHKLTEIQVWEKSIKLCKMIYQLTSQFPEEEKFGLISQIRRSVVSISSNIAEGAGRYSQKEFIRFLSIANGSSYEFETQILIAKELGFISNEEYQNIYNQIKEIQKMIFGFKKHLHLYQIV